MDFKMTPQDAWTSALIFGAVGIALLIPLAFLFRAPQFQRAAWALTVASALLWGVLAAVAMLFFWEFYYRYIYPGWGRWLAPLDLLLYAAIGLGMWWLASRIPGSLVVWFALLGGLEGVAEHLIGIYTLHILEKVPWLQGMPVLPVTVFSFFEYILYWTLVAWMGFVLLKIAQVITAYAGSA